MSGSQRGRLAATPRNLAILYELRSALAEAAAATHREATIRLVEEVAATTPERPLLSRARSRWSWRIGTLFAVLDLVSITAAWLAARGAHDGAAYVVTAVIALAAANRADLHRSRLELSVLDDVPAYLAVAVLGGLALSVLSSVGLAGSTTSAACLLFGAVVFGAGVLSRLIAFPVVRTLRRGRLIGHPVLIVGAGDVGRRLAAAMRAHPEHGLKPVGFIDFDPPPAHTGDPLLPVLGDIAELPAVLRQYDVHDIVFAFGKRPDADLVRVVRSCVRMDLQVFVVPRYFELCGSDRRAHIETLWGIPLLRLRRWPLHRGNRWIKRMMDVFIAACALVALSPVLALCALAVRLDGGPVIFRQQRVGRDGRTFVLYKFRSMRGGSDTEWTPEDSPRITAVGRLLRSWSLDELPQLLNVLRGDMSLVGPRPERPYFVNSFSHRVRRYGERHRVATGLTGWAQVNGLRGDTSIEERIAFDNYYIENWSIWSDVKIMLRTVVTFARHRPAEVADVATIGRPRAVPALPDVLAS